MFVAKRFKWEAAHRIPWHSGKCKNLHGHSYKMDVELEGEIDAQGIVVDFHDIKHIINPIVDQLDHSTIISEKDSELLEVFKAKNWKYFLVPFDSTAENLCDYFLKLIVDDNRDFLTEKKITKIGIRMYETDTAYAYKCITIGS
mgnify:CR=1 FL=1